MGSEERKEMAKALSEPGFKGLVIGSQVIFPPMQVGEQSFHFNHAQVGFLYALQKLEGDIEGAAHSVGQTVEWAKKFITSRKFRAFRNAKLAAASVRNGDLVNWWWKFGLDGAKGIKQWYEGTCELCHERNVLEVAEAEMMRNDDMRLEAHCALCQQAIQLELKEEEVKPSREQVQFWSELGNRLSPKVERIQHEFTAERFTFVTEDA